MKYKFQIVFKKIVFTRTRVVEKEILLHLLADLGILPHPCPTAMVSYMIQNTHGNL